MVEEKLPDVQVDRPKIHRFRKMSQILKKRNQEKTVTTRAPTVSANGEDHHALSPLALGIMTMVFLGFFLSGLFFLLIQKTAPVEGFGLEAHSPSEFPEIFAFDPIAELASQAAVASAGENSTAEREFTVARPPLSEGIFPCSNCHAGMEPDPKVREVGPPHDNIKLHHGSNEERWCLNCHDAKNRDMLRLTSGKLIPFEESYRLCGQCHGNVFRDWKAGIHGRRMGFWNGKKLYLLCVHCHDQHSPRFKPLKPLPPPERPDFLRSGSK